MTEYTDNLIAEARAKFEAAHTELIRILSIDEQVRMTIPADPVRDTDLVIVAALDAGRALAAALGAVQPVTPDRVEAKRLSDYIRREIAQSPSTVYVTLSSQQALDAAVLLASGVRGQPQPQPCNHGECAWQNGCAIDPPQPSGALDAATEAVEAVLLSIEKGSDHGPRDIAEAALDALLPLLGQPRTDVEDER